MISVRKMSELYTCMYITPSAEIERAQRAQAEVYNRVLRISGAERGGAVWEQSRKHTNNNLTSKKENEENEKTHKHSLKQKINQPNEQQRRKTKKPQRRNLI